MKKQYGGTLLGFIMGALIGLGAALAVAVYITKVPMPFMNKTPARAAENEAAEAQKNRDWDPNSGLANKPAVKPAPADVPAVDAPSADPLGDLASAKSEATARSAVPAQPLPALSPSAVPVVPSPTSAASADPFNYFVQAGAFRTPEDAEQQRAKLVLMGLQPRVSEREQSGRVVYRVRLGPFDKKDDADKAKTKLDSSGIEAALVRVQK
jgi:cell division protein FtsN